MWKKIRPYVLHMRPLSWPIVIIHFTLGFVLADGFKMGYNIVLIWIIGFFIWAVLLNSGALAFNSFYDKDKGDITWLNNPPKVPKNLLMLSCILIILGLFLAYFISFKFFMVALVSVVIALLYSYPPVRLKRITGLDAFANATVYGATTLYAGWVLTNKTFSPVIGWMLLAMFILIYGAYPLSTLYQYDEDIKKGDRTLTSFLGKKKGILLSITSLTIFLVILLYEVIKGYMPYYSLSVFVLAIYGYKKLIYFYSNIGRMSAKDTKKEMYKGYATWAVADILLIVSVLL